MRDLPCPRRDGAAPASSRTGGGCYGGAGTCRRHGGTTTWQRQTWHSPCTPLHRWWERRHNTGLLHNRQGSPPLRGGRHATWRC
jgi:hypothetical protein